jgi:hypothetical protein
LRSPRFQQIVGTPGGVPGVLTFLVFLGVQKDCPSYTFTAIAQQCNFAAVTICLHQIAGSLLLRRRVHLKYVHLNPLI